MFKNFVICFLFPFTLLLVLISGKEVDSVDSTSSSQVVDFMKRFGYLKSGTNSEAIYSKESYSLALKNVQRFGAIPTTGILDEATLKLISSPRCGLPDISQPSSSSRTKRFVLFGTKWHKRQLTFYISHTPSYLDKETVARNIQRALDIWGKYGNMIFTRVEDPAADIVVLFARGEHGDSFNFDGRGKTLAHAFYPNSGIGGDVHFDEDEPWTTNLEETNEKIDFFTVAVHELGHSMGLGHSDVRSSIMFPYYQDPKENLELDYDDILAMYELYSSNRGNEDHDTTRKTTTRRYYEPTRRPFRPSRRTTHIPEISPKNPNICEEDYDSIVSFRGELFVFKGKYLWRYQEKQALMSGYPALLEQMFTDIPNEIEKIDAAYERPDGIIVLFTGNKYWQFDGSRVINSPRPLTDYGLPSYLDKIDAVQNWRANEKTYFYRNGKFWRYNENTKRMDSGYPRGMQKWRGVPENIDSAITWNDDITYFFKGNYYWTFDNKKVRVTNNSPSSVTRDWFGCSR